MAYVLEQWVHFPGSPAWACAPPLTGRWKIKIQDDASVLYLETVCLTHAGLRSDTTAWVHENDLRIVNRETFINECGG